MSGFESRERCLRVRDGGHRSIASLDEPGALDLRSPSGYLSRRGTRRYTTQNKSAIDMCQAEARCPVLIKVKTPKVDDFLECFVVWVWRHIYHLHIIASDIVL